MRYREIIEHKVNEVERGGGIDDRMIDDLHNRDISSDQLDLFEPNPTGMPRLPPNYKMLGRMGPLFVAERFADAKHTPAPKSDDYAYGTRNIVFVNNSKGVGEMFLAPWTARHMEYHHQVNNRPDLCGNGYMVKAVLVMPEFRGKGLGVAMYKWCLENICDYIISDVTHTTDGERLWQKMLGMRSVFAVEVWDANKYQSRRRWKGKDFEQVYKQGHLQPWVTLRSKLDYVLSGEED